MKRMDVSKLDFIRIEPRGKAILDKFWVSYNGVLMLVKPSGFKVDQDVMEMISSVILKKIGLKSVDVQLGYDAYSRKKCCMVTNFLTEVGDNSYDMLDWTVETGENALEKSFQQVFTRYSHLYDIDEEQWNDLKIQYIRTLLGKCIIENFDSKLENIGLIFNEKTKTYKIPPSYDNGFAFRSYSHVIEPVCFVGNQFFEIQDVLKYMVKNYYENIQDVLDALDTFVTQDLDQTLSKYQNEIIPEKIQYISSYLNHINRKMQEYRQEFSRNR